MPPCTCRPEAITRLAASEHHTLAVEAATEASGSPAAMRPGRVPGARAHPLHVDHHVGAAVLDGLEAPDGLVELHAVLGVLGRHLEHPAGPAQHLGRGPDRTPVEEADSQVGRLQADGRRVVEGQPATGPGCRPSPARPRGARPMARSTAKTPLDVGHHGDVGHRRPLDRAEPPDSVHSSAGVVAVTGIGMLAPTHAADALAADQVGHPVGRAVLGRGQHA